MDVGIIVAVIAAIVAIISTILSLFVQLRISKLEQKFNRKLEFEKSELTVWEELRKDILSDMWKAHREVVKGMTIVILKTQEMEQKKDLEKLLTAIEKFRQIVHNQIDLMSPDALEISQKFLETAQEIREGKLNSNDANPLKAIRREFYEYTAKFYGVEKMMPWMAKSDPSVE
jgi:hypothetical protein